MEGHRRFGLGLAALVVLAGCGDSAHLAARGPATPRAAVERFLGVLAAPMPYRPTDQARAQREVAALWRRLCRTVDPELRTLRAYEDQVADPLANCGGAVIILALETPDSSDVPPTSGLGWSVGRATDRGSIGFVSTTLRYRRLDRKPGWSVDAEVLVVRRGGSWWVGTPQAVNPGFTRKGGLSEPRLRREYRHLLRIAGGSPP